MRPTLILRTAVLPALLLAVGCQPTQPPRELAPFTPTTYGNWTAVGPAFADGPAGGKLLSQLEITNTASSHVITSETRGDKPTGTLLSPPFKLERDYLAFRIAGGDYEYNTALHLLVDGQIVRTATGRNSDKLRPESWDIRPYRGKLAQLMVVDDATGDWGHINVDAIAQTDKPEALPVNTAPLYAESLRPQFHFTAKQFAMTRLEPGQRQEGWINDLNGLIYYDGEYHLFAQRWAKCWLHAVSKDLVHWTELAPAFWEEELGVGDQSGTCVVDYANTSGLSPDPKNPPLVAFWSRFDNRTHHISYSLDHGRTWKRHPGNPILEAPERDPKVFWYAPPDGTKGHWVMFLYGNDAYHIFTSPDLLHWSNEHNPIRDSFECPDFFELPVDGDSAKKKWVLIQGNGNYSIGTFDGKKFTEETTRLPCDVGPNFYATQSWHNTDTLTGPDQNRRVQVAWMRGPDFPKMPFNQQISFPCELTLRTTPAGLRIFREPVKEITKVAIAGETKQWNGTTVLPGSPITLATSGDLYRLVADVTIPVGSKLILTLRGNDVILGEKSLESDHKPASVQGAVHFIEVLLDRGSIETFVNGGELSSTRFALGKSEGLSLRAEGGPVTIRSLTLQPLKSAWPAR